jgi:hypothetical protein
MKKMLKNDNHFAANVRTMNSIQIGQLDNFIREKRNFKEIKNNQEAKKTQEATTALQLLFQDPSPKL